MVAVGNVDTKVSALGDRVTGIEGDRQDEKVARKTEASLAASRQRRLLTLISASRGGIALLISFTTAVWVIVHGHA